MERKLLLDSIARPLVDSAAFVKESSVAVDCIFENELELVTDLLFPVHVSMCDLSWKRRFFMPETYPACKFQIRSRGGGPIA